MAATINWELYKNKTVREVEGDIARFETELATCVIPKRRAWLLDTLNDLAYILKQKTR